MSIFDVILKLHIPIVVLLILVIIVLKSRKNSITGKFTLSFFGFFKTDVAINQVAAIKIVATVLLCVLTIFYYLLIDFSQFYPQKLKMTVHFDKKGLNELYQELNVKEIDGLPIDMVDDSARKAYILASDKTLTDKYKFTNFFSKALIDSTATMVTEGSTTFIVKKKGGIQNYFIEDASGELTHSLYEPKQEIKSIKTSFTKSTSANDKIKFNYISVFFGKEIIISPLFTENLVVSTNEGSKENIQLDHFLYGLTSIKVSPVPSYSNTLYLYRTKSKLIPICYTIYIDE